MRISEPALCITPGNKFTFSPEGVKILAETLGNAPAYDLSSVGGANLQSTQYLEVIKPVMDGPGNVDILPVFFC